MPDHDLAIRGGLVATGFGAIRCDVGIRDGRIATLAEAVTDAAQVIEADGLYVLPGGVDSHCHIEEPSRGGYTMSDGEPQVTVNEESFVTASTSAFAGGTTSVVCFVPQWKGFGVWSATRITAAAPRRACWTTASTRSSATRRPRCWSRRCRASSPTACAA
jgi:dihydropyrimidinase